jgi:hypothetical protein
MSTKTLLVTKRNGDEFQIDIPENWKITFGPTCVGVGKTAGVERIPLCLRIYESDTLQRAIFTDVVSFRDMSIPIRIKQTNIQEKVGYVEYDGKRKQTSFQAKTSEWINPDTGDFESKLLNMPSDLEMGFEQSEQ